MIKILCIYSAINIKININNNNLVMIIINQKIK